MGFYDTMEPYAQQANTETGIPVSVILAQWGLETGKGTHLAGKNNYAGITKGGVSAGFVDYGSISDFVAGWIKTINNGYYRGVLNTAQVGTPEQTAQALGDSPWDAGHYYINYPGEKLINLINTDNLKQYDTGGGGVPFGPPGPPANTKGDNKSLLDRAKAAVTESLPDTSQIILLVVLGLTAATLIALGALNLVKD